MKEKELTGTLLAVDRANDLAIIRVKDKDLPPPMPIAPSSEIPEGTTLQVVGFPLGSGLAESSSGAGANNRVLTKVSVRNTTVVGRIAFKNGGARYVQLEGGADHGNSGGMIVDQAGYVRSVLDAGDPGTNMRFGIPSEYAVYLLQGRIVNLIPGQAYKSGDVVKQPLVASIVDPMKRIRKATVEMWAGSPSKVGRPASETRPQPEAGDSPRSQCDIAYNPDSPVKLGEPRLAGGEIELPPLRDGQVYWMQPKYERIDGSTRWGEAMVANFAVLPVERSGANLTVKHETGGKAWSEMYSKFGSGLVPEGYPARVRTREWTVTLDEKTRQVDSEGTAVVYLEVDQVKASNADEQEWSGEQYEELTKLAKGTRIEMSVTNRGLVKNPKVNAAAVPPMYRAFMERMCTQIAQSVEQLGMSLPGKDVSPGEEWFFDIPYKLFITRDRTDDVTYRLSFKYLGKRSRNGRDEGVVTFFGRIIKGSGGSEAAAATTSPDQIDEQKEREKGIFGVAEGAAVIDLKTGTTLLARAESSLAVDYKFKRKVRNEDGEIVEQEIPVTLVLVGETSLQRVLEKDAPRVNLRAYLPNQKQTLYPFVGMPDESTFVATAPSATGTSPGGETNVREALSMPPTIIERLRKQACLVRAFRTDSPQEDGAGWLAEPGIVVTAAHLLGMVDRSSRPPISIDVYFNAGTPNVKKFPAKILTVDQLNDLCVLQFSGGKDMPEPMTIVPSTDLRETQRLAVVGYPGQGVNQQFSMDPMSVKVSFRNSYVIGRADNVKTGLLRYIRVEGGLIDGNFGGAVVDMNGAVRGIAANYVPESEKRIMCNCIPAEYAQRLLWGYPLETRPKLPYQADSTIAKLPVEVKFGDPLKRVKKVWLEYWTGRPGLPRRPSATAPKPRPDDTGRQTVEAQYDPETMLATGEFVLPDLDPGSAYWIQPRYIDGTGNEKWGEAIFFAPDGSPVERRDIVLKPKFSKGSVRIIEVDSDADYRYVVLGRDRGHVMSLSARLSERMLGVDAQTRLQGVEYKFDDVKFGQPRSRPEVIQLLLAGVDNQQLFKDQIRRLILRAGFTNDGLLKKSAIDTTQVANPVHAVMYGQFSNQVLEAIQLMSIKFPNCAVKIDETWEQPLSLHLETRKKHEPALYTLKMKYLGVRNRGGRNEAVIDITGSIARDEKEETINLKSKDDKDEDEKDGENKEGAGDGKGGDGKGMSSLMQAPKPKDPPKPKEPGKPKETPKPKDKDGAGKDAGKEKDDVPATPGKKPLYGLVRGTAYIDLETGAVSMCRLFIDVDTEITVKDPQTKADMSVRAGGTIKVSLVRHASDR